MKTDKFNLFSSFVKKYYLNIDNESLINYTYNIKNMDSGVTKSNANGWQSKELKNDNDITFSRLLSSIDYCCRDYFFYVGVNCEQWVPKMDGIWANINSKYSYNHRHLHTGFCSGVYYVKTDGDEGDIRFCNPSAAKHMSWTGNYFREPFNESNASDWRFTPVKGDLYIFPSWLEHYVDMNTTDKDRISYSFNVNIEKNHYKYK